VQEKLGKTYDAMVRTNEGFGLSEQAAIDLTREILHIPPGVDVKSWMSDEAKRMAQATTGELNGIDGRKVTAYAELITKKITQYEEIFGPTGKSASLFEAQNGGATGGRVSEIMGFAGGGRQFSGRVPAPRPSNMSKDNILGLVNGKPIGLQGQEWIVNGRSSNEYDRELAAINAGTFPKMPGYASGGGMGREYSAQALGYAPYSAAPATGSAGPTFGDVVITQQSDPIATWHEFARRAHNLSV
jgi:hypothetical protein